MNTDSFLVLDVIILLVALILLVWAINRDRHETRKVSSDVAKADLEQRSAQEQKIARGSQTTAQANLNKDEFQASFVSEQIEEMVKQRLMSYEDLIEVEIDFGSAEDGSLEIWFAGRRYVNVDQIPDYRVRDAIAESVQAFNQESKDGGDVV
jgi:hypothetical protein